MGVACLGQPRSKAQLMKKNQDINSRYSSNLSKTSKTGNKSELVAAEAQGNKLKIKINLITCSVCMQIYNITTRVPQIICANNHTYCKECSNQFDKTTKKCPECRGEMKTPVIRNRDVYQLVEDNLQIIDENKFEHVKAEQNDCDDARITVDLKTQCIDSFWIEGERVMKIENDRVWEGFISNELLPLDRQSSFSVKIVYSKHNNIELGIVGKGYRFQPNVTCRESVVYHLADGRILEGSKGTGSEWKGQGTKYENVSGLTAIITVKVNPKQYKVSWFQGDKMLGQGRFSEFLKKREFVAYFMMCHKQDIVELNP